MERRNERITELIHHQIAELIAGLFDFGGAIVTVSAVILSKNRSHATVYFTVYPFERAGEVVSALQNKVAAIQRKLNSQLEIRPVPKITFALDEGEERGRHILDLIDKVK